jgi:hypothetical protein
VLLQIVFSGLHNILVLTNSTGESPPSAEDILDQVLHLKGPCGTVEVDGRKADLLLVEKVTNLGTDVLPLVAKLVVVGWIEVLQATIRLWSLGHDEGILQRAVASSLGGELELPA